MKLYIQQKTKELEAAKSAMGFHMILKIAKKLMGIVYWTIERWLNKYKFQGCHTQKVLEFIFSTI